MKLPMRSWTKLLGQLAPSSRRRRRANKKSRSSRFQSLELRQLLTVTVLDGTTTYYNDPYATGTPSDDFGSTPMGTPVDKTFTIQNTDSTEVTLTAGSLSLPPGFSLVDSSFPSAVPASGSTTFTVQMDATSVGNPSGELSFSDSDPNDTSYQFAINGTVTTPPPVITVWDGATEWDNDTMGMGTPSDDFGSTPAGTPVQKTFTIRKLRRCGHQFGRQFAALPLGFSLVDSSFPSVVPAGGSTTFTVQMDASSVGNPSGELSFSDDDPGGSFYQFAISGTVTTPPPVITVWDGATEWDNDTMGMGTPSDDFGSTPAGTPVQKTFTIENSGAADINLGVNSLALPLGFSLVDSSFPSVVPAGGSTTFTVQMDASSVGNPSGELSFSDDDPGGSFYQFAISGTVTTPPPVITVWDGATEWDNDTMGMGTPSDDFGSTPAGTPVQKTFTIENSGAADINLGVNSLALPLGFSLVDSSFPSVVPAGGSTTFTVQMDASSVGNPSGELSFSDDDPGGSFYQFAISGTVTTPPPVITVLDGATEWDNDTMGMGTPSDDFGSTPAGTPVQKTFTIENSGAADINLGVNSLALPLGFSLVDSSFPSVVPAGGSTTFTVQMDASSVGNPSGELSFSDDDPGGSFYQFAINGTVTTPPPVITVWDGATEWDNDTMGMGTPSDDFGSTPAGTPVQKTFTIQNSGETDINLGTGSLSLPLGFSLVDSSFPSVVPAGGSTTFTVQMDAASVGNPSGELSFSDDDPGGNYYQFAISGTVTANTGPAMALSDGGTGIANGGSDAFGSVLQGDSDSKTFTVSNNGTASLSVSAITLPSGYSLQTTLPLNIAAGGSTTFAVALDTSTAGTFSGQMSITDSDANNDPYVVNLSGTVTTPAPAMSLLDGGTAIANGGSDAFGSVAVGDSDTKTFTVSNTGTASLSVSAITLPSGYSLQTTLPLNIAAGSSATFTVALDTSTAGTFSGQMSITDSDANNDPYVVDLSGAVTAPVMSLADSGAAIANGGSDAFGSVLVGASDSKTFTVSNTGTAALSVSAITLPSGYSLQTTLPLSIAAGDSATFTVALDTSTAGTFSGPMSITDSDANNDPYVVDLSGAVTAPVMSLADGGTESPTAAATRSTACWSAG